MNRQKLIGQVVYSAALLSLAALVYGQSPQNVAPAASSAAPSSSAARAAAASSSAGSSAPASSSAAGQASTTAQTRNLAGTVAIADGSALQYGPDRVAHKIAVGDKIYEGDALVTMPDAELHVNMADGGYLALRPNTTLRVTLYQANGDASDKSVIGLLKGSFRSITGWIGKTYPANYAINTPTATIGVRGTDHEPAYVPEGTPGQDAGTYDNVYAGGTTISNAAGRVDVSPDHAGFVDPRRTVAPRVLEHVPTFLQTPHRNDQAFVGKHEQIMANLEKLRTARAQQHVEEIKNGTAVKPGPTSLRDRLIQGHAESTLAAQHRALSGNGTDEAQRRAAEAQRAQEGQHRAGEAQAQGVRHPLLDQRKSAASPASPAEHAALPQPRSGAAAGNGEAAARLEEARRQAEAARAKAASAPAQRPEPAKKKDEPKRP
jgi:hypothetical protein